MANPTITPSITQKMEFTYRFIHPADNPSPETVQQIADFLYEHLEDYGDPKSQILDCLHYALGTRPEQGGFVCLAEEAELGIVGAVVFNHTHMSGYIPENILVYIAVHKEARGKGLGGELMQRVIEESEGGIALHVEPDNPAARLYERMGFRSKYLEMRLERD